MNAAHTHSYSGTKSRVAKALLLLLTGLAACNSAELDPLQRGWKMVGNELLPHAPILQQAEESSCFWQTKQERGRVTISRQAKFYQSAQEIRVETPHGSLIGTNHGEWGGTLTLSRGKAEPPEKILDQGVLRIIPVKTGFLVITGSLPRNEGTLWLYLGAINQESKIEKKADLHGYPLAVLETASGIWVANGDSIYRLDDKFNVQNAIEMPWLQLHPNSIAEDKRGAVYVGMQAFVVRLMPARSGYMSEWFAGDGCLR